eukprot:126153-Prorocentrum_minimum.AAC.1
MVQKWRLYAPEMSPYLYPRHNMVYAMVSQVDVHAVDHSRFPLFRRAFPVEVTLEEGETLFLPTGWWHAVDGLDTPSISVGATNWVRARNNNTNGGPEGVQRGSRRGLEGV